MADHTRVREAVLNLLLANEGMDTSMRQREAAAIALAKSLGLPGTALCAQIADALMSRMDGGAK